MEKSVQDFILIFTSILYEALPFIVLGAVIAGILEEFVPQQAITRLIPRSPAFAVALSALLGLVFPMCECGIIPIMRRLLRKGLPLSCCVAYILAGPIINPIVMFSTYVAFAPYPASAMGGAWMVSLRVGLAYLVSVGTAMVVHRLYLKHGTTLLAPLAIPPVLKQADAVEAQKAELGEADEEAGGNGTARRRFFQRLANISETALHDFVDITVFLILGALLAAFVRQFLIYHPELAELARTHPPLAIGFMMVLAVMLCLCSEADAFVAANMAEVPPAAKLSFLGLGPMLDIKLYLMYTRVFRPRLIWTIISCVVVQVFAYSLLVHFVWTRTMTP